MFDQYADLRSKPELIFLDLWCQDYWKFFGQRRDFLGCQLGIFEDMKRLYQVISITLSSVSLQIQTVSIYLWKRKQKEILLI